jgi:hypothetical protein
LPPEGSPLPVHPDAEQLADTFVTSDGKLLVDVLEATLDHAVKRGVAVHLGHVDNPFARDASDARGRTDLVAVFTAEKRYDDPGRTDRFWRNFDIEFDFLRKYVRYEWLESPDGVAYGVRLGLPARCRKDKKSRGELRQALQKCLSFRCTVTGARGEAVARSDLDDVLDVELGPETRGGERRLP